MRARLSRHASRSMSGGGVGGMTNRARLEPDAGGVADERDAGVGVEVADVVRRVSRRVGHVEVAAAGGEALAAAQDDEGVLAAPAGISPQSRSISSPHSRVALAISFAGIDHVRRALLVHVDAQRRILAHQRAGRAGVIEMNVRQQNRAHVGHRDARLLERRAQRRQRARRSGIDERHAAGTVQHDRRDDARHAEEVADRDTTGPSSAV